ncbi:MAG: DMT family transporter [Pseudomonadota bacterium]
MPTRYWILLVILGSAFGTSFALNEVLLAHYGPITISAMRVVLGAMGCWLWLFATGRTASGLGAMLLGVAVFGIFQYAAPFAVLALAQGEITSSVAGIANGMTPVAVVVISHLWPGGERATARKGAGVALGLAGIACIALLEGEAGASDPRFVAIAVGAPICYGIALNLVRRFGPVDPVVLTAWAMTGGAAVIAPLARSLEGVPVMPDAQAALAIGVLGFGITSAGFLGMFWLLPRIGATNASLVTFIAPVSATFLGVVALGETLGAGHVGGMLLILLGLICIDGRLIAWARERFQWGVVASH